MGSDTGQFRTERQAAQDFRDMIARVLTCVDRGAYVAAAPPDAAGVAALTLTNGGALPLPGAAGLALRVTFLYRVVPVGRQFRVTTAAYFHSVDDADGNEVVSWEWHPVAPEGGPHRVRHPHLHVSAGAGRSLRAELSRAHLVTNRVALEEVLLTLIADFGVAPATPDYARVFAGTLARFRAERTWAGDYDPDTTAPVP